MGIVRVRERGAFHEQRRHASLRERIDNAANLGRKALLDGRVPATAERVPERLTECRDGSVW